MTDSTNADPRSDDLPHVHTQLANPNTCKPCKEEKFPSVVSQSDMEDDFALHHVHYPPIYSTDNIRDPPTIYLDESVLAILDFSPVSSRSLQCDETPPLRPKHPLTPPPTAAHAWPVPASETATYKLRTMQIDSPAPEATRKSDRANNFRFERASPTVPDDQHSPSEECQCKRRKTDPASHHSQVRTAFIAPSTVPQDQRTHSNQIEIHAHAPDLTSSTKASLKAPLIVEGNYVNNRPLKGQSGDAPAPVHDKNQNPARECIPVIVANVVQAAMSASTARQNDEHVATPANSLKRQIASKRPHPEPANNVQNCRIGQLERELIALRWALYQPNPVGNAQQLSSRAQTAHRRAYYSPVNAMQMAHLAEEWSRNATPHPRQPMLHMPLTAVTKCDLLLQSIYNHIAHAVEAGTVPPSDSVLRSTRDGIISTLQLAHSVERGPARKRMHGSSAASTVAFLDKVFAALLRAPSHIDLAWGVAVVETIVAPILQYSQSQSLHIYDQVGKCCGETMRKAATVLSMHTCQPRQVQIESRVRAIELTSAILHIQDAHMLSTIPAENMEYLRANLSLR